MATARLRRRAGGLAGGWANWSMGGLVGGMVGVWAARMVGCGSVAASLPKTSDHKPQTTETSTCNNPIKISVRSITPLRASGAWWRILHFSCCLDSVRICFLFLYFRFSVFERCACIHPDSFLKRKRCHPTRSLGHRGDRLTLPLLSKFSQCNPAHVCTQRGFRSVTNNQAPIQEGLHSALCFEIAQIEFVGTSRRQEVGTAGDIQSQLPPHP